MTPKTLTSCIQGRFSSEKKLQKTVSRVPSGVAPEDEHHLLAADEAIENFKNVVKSGTTFSPKNVELGITVGM